jgi:hypothetical protein
MRNLPGRYLLGRLLQLLGIPGFIRPWTYQTETGEVLALRTSPRYTVLKVGGRDYYFIRESGRFDGVGESTDSSTEVNRYMAESIRRSAATRGRA